MYKLEEHLKKGQVMVTKKKLNMCSGFCEIRQNDIQYVLQKFVIKD